MSEPKLKDQCGMPLCCRIAAGEMPMPTPKPSKKVCRECGEDAIQRCCLVIWYGEGYQTADTRQNQLIEEKHTRLRGKPFIDYGEVA